MQRIIRFTAGRKALRPQPCWQDLLSWSSPAVRSRYAHDTARPPATSTAPFVPRIQRTGPSYVRRQLDEEAAASHAPISIEEFEQLAQQGQANKQDAAACLYQRRAALQKLPREEMLEQIREQECGRRMLVWVWRQRLSGTVVGGQQFTNLLCWFLLLEGLESRIWEWLTRECEHATSRTQIMSIENWAHHWLSSLSSAQVACAKTSPAEAALKCWEKGIELCKVLYGPSTKARYGILVALRIQVDQIITDPKTIPYDEQLFDSYVKTVPRVDVNYGRIGYRTALAWLYHPTDPTGLPLYTYVWMNHHQMNMLWQKARVSVKDAWVHWLHRAAYILHLQLQDEEARWLSEYIHRNAKDSLLRRRKDAMGQLTADPKLERLRNESKQCSPFDSGSGLSNSRSKTAEMAPTRQPPPIFS